MRILHIVSDLGQGGAQSYVLDLLKQHEQQPGIYSELLALFFKGALWDRVEGLNIRASCLEIRGALDIPGFYRLYRHLIAGSYDIVHVHHIHPAVSALVGRLPGKNIYTEHGGGLLGGGWIEKLVYHWFHSNYCRFIAISREMDRVMAAENPAVKNRIRVVYNGVDLEKIDTVDTIDSDKVPRQFNNASLRVGIIGRLEKQKGIENFIDAAIIIAASHDNVVFPVIGDGSLMEHLKAKSKSLGIGDRVLFLGYRTDAIEILSRFDLLLFTSEYEPFGLVLTEAMAAGIPVVALHKKGAVPEIINDGVEGYVIRNGGAQALAERACSLLDDTELRSQMAEAARARVEAQFTMQGNANRILEIYSECLESNEKTPVEVAR